MRSTVRFSFLRGKIHCTYFLLAATVSRKLMQFMFFFLAIQQIDPHLINCIDTPRDEFCKSGVSPTFCEGKSPGKYEHHTICNKFIDCSHRRGFVQDCPTGTGFNPFFRNCDWPGFLRCVDIKTGMHFFNNSKSELALVSFSLVIPKN